MDTFTKNQITEKTIEEIKDCMSRVLDDCELELGQSERWKVLRSRILKNFGDRGLTGRVSQILNKLEST